MPTGTSRPLYRQLRLMIDKNHEEIGVMSLMSAFKWPWNHKKCLYVIIISSDIEMQNDFFLREKVRLRNITDNFSLFLASLISFWSRPKKAANPTQFLRFTNHFLYNWQKRIDLQKEKEYFISCIRII